MQRIETLPVGIVVERRDSGHPWQEQTWLPVAVIPGAPKADPSVPWKKLREGEGWEQYLAGTLTVEVHRTETLDDWTLDGDYIHKNFPGLSPQAEHVHVVTDSDELGFVSVTPEAVVSLASLRIS